MYSQTTHSIEVTVAPTYLESQSRPTEGLYVWSYDIQIANHGDATVQLRQRHWRISSANGQLLEVKGEGVVGVEPVIKPGDRFSYSSFTNLTTPSGLMWGEYTVETPGGERLVLTIPAFSLDSPEQRALPN